MSWIPALPEASSTCHCGEHERAHGWLTSGIEGCGGFVPANWPGWSPRWWL